MDILKTIREIGYFETGRNIVDVIDSVDVQEKVNNVMPMPDCKLGEAISEIAKWLIGFDKKKYLFLNPEIALIDKIAEINPKQESILLIPCDMNQEVRLRLKDNIPKSMSVSLLEEPFFPEGFNPGNGLMIIGGYLASGRMMVLPETYRMINHYNGFWGKKVFVPYVELPDAVRYDGWMEVEDEKINVIWRNEYDKYNHA